MKNPSVDEFISGKPITYKGFDSRKTYVASFDKKTCAITVRHRGKKQFDVNVEGVKEAKSFYWNQTRKAV